ncbi:hypothetical protein ACFCZ4_21050 [Streptomyces microflavus]|uniref:DNA-directed RNA polymerase specialized sigma subunit, sigma24 family n=1 Tax=Streptomyces microflavus TaxID=1919 RepID=A0A7H8MH12_STRMI|nr:hypothetical protein [Streptomyces microflavus]QKW41488.1 hypothetical protein HUT09_02360 [Streptomyces microflavus]
MPIHQPQQRSAAPTTGTGEPLGVQQAEAALVEHYPRLVRLAYVVLPPSLGRHRRVLAAHGTVQRALPGARTAPDRMRVPAQSRRSSEAAQEAQGPANAPYAWMRLRVLRTALAHERRPRWWPARLPAPAALRPTLPVVWGLRLFPRAGGVDELALDRALSTVPGAVRAAFALQLLEGLSESSVRALLSEAGEADPAGAVRRAARLGRPDRAGAQVLLQSGEFDPCAVQTRPSDLLRRRHRVRAVALAAALCVVAGTLAVAAERGVRGVADEGPAAGVTVPALDPAALLRTAAEQWADTSRIDFTAWSVRGDRRSDGELLGRALRAWSGPPAGVRVSTTPGTADVPPAQPPRLLFAGEVDGAAVVLFHDGGVRVVRYAEPLSGGGGAALDFARTDDADVTTGAAVVVSRTGEKARFLLAPWISETTTRDLLAPNTPSRPLEVGPDGVTAPVERPAAGGACDSWPVLQLRSSERIVENHAFLVTDLGDLAPAHLTYTPKPGRGAPARQPREATGTEALLAWARTACSLRALSGSGVRAVNNWAFAEQRLPEGEASAEWLCTRADTWRGPGRVLVQFLRPAASPTAPAAVVADRNDTALCSRFGQHILAGTHWKSASGRWYVLAAGSRAVDRIEATGQVRGAAGGPTLAVRAPRDASVQLTARLREGGTLAAVR